MDNILIILIGLLVLAVLILVIITLRGKKKTNDNLKEDVIELKKEEPVIELKKEEPVIELNDEVFNDEVIDDLEQTREQTEVIEIISSMQEKAKDLTEKVADYEDEQEENAIISYTELLNAVKAKKEVQEELNFDIKEPVQNEVPVQKPYDDNHKFRQTEPISPLGRIDNKTKNDNQSEDFLKSLKDFRSNL